MDENILENLSAGAIISVDVVVVEDDEDDDEDDSDDEDSEEDIRWSSMLQVDTA